MWPLGVNGCSKYKVTLYGSLAETGKGHLTDIVIGETLGFDVTEIVFDCHQIPEDLAHRVNPLVFEAQTQDGVFIFLCYFCLFIL